MLFFETSVKRDRNETVHSREDLRTNQSQDVSDLLTNGILKCILMADTMNVLKLFRRTDSPVSLAKGESQIRVYRAHAARAISEERWDVAEIFLDHILSVDPSHTEAWLMKGHLREHCRSDEQAAVECYRKVITICGHGSQHPHAERARTSLGNLLAVWG